MFNPGRQSPFYPKKKIHLYKLKAHFPPGFSPVYLFSLHLFFSEHPRSPAGTGQPVWCPPVLPPPTLREPLPDTENQTLLPRQERNQICKHLMVPLLHNAVRNIAECWITVCGIKNFITVAQNVRTEESHSYGCLKGNQHEDSKGSFVTWAQLSQQGYVQGTKYS